MKDVPFSPQFILSVQDIFYPDVYMAKKSYSMSIDAMEKLRKQARVDWHRTKWKTPDGKQSGEFVYRPACLTQNEFLGVNAAAFSPNGERYGQGGLLQTPYTLMQLWLMELGITGLRQARITLSRDKDKNLVTRHYLSTTHLQKNVGEDVNVKPGCSLAVYDYSCVLRSKEDGCHVALSDKYRFKLDQVLWDEDVMPAIKEKLKNTVQMTKSDLFMFVPCLSDGKAFTAQFAMQLAKQTPVIQLAAEKFIRDCYCDRPRKLKSIMSQIYKAKRKEALSAFLAKHEWIVPVALGCIVGIMAVGIVAALVLSGVGIFAVGAAGAGVAAYLASNVGLVGVFAGFGGLMGSAFAIAATEMFASWGKKVSDAAKRVVAVGGTTKSLSGALNGAEGLRSSVESEPRIASDQSSDIDAAPVLQSPKDQPEFISARSLH